MIHLNIGSNLNSKFGTRFDNINIAVNQLIKSKIRILKCSNFYETPSYPNKSLPKFINVGVLACYKKNFKELLNIISLIEKKIGRIKTKKNDPRVIDIDIIDFGGSVKYSKEIVLPHPRSHLRNFVLFPIFEIEKNWFHPKKKQSVTLLLKKLHLKSLSTIKIFSI